MYVLWNKLMPNASDYGDLIGYSDLKVWYVQVSMYVCVFF